jgi:electron transfer flavoprotein beta subunit
VSESPAILVCVKRAVDPSTVVVSARRGEIVDAGTWGLNVGDRPALELAIHLAEMLGVAWGAVTIGAAESDEVLREALARSTLRAVRVWDDALAEADGAVRARVLEAAVRRASEVRYVVAGTGSPAGSQAQVPARLAERLGWVVVRNVGALERANDREVQVTIQTPRFGARTIPLPERAVLTAAREAFPLRLPKAAALMRAFRAPIDVWSAADLELAAEDLAPQTHVIRTEVPEPAAESV